MKIAFITRSTLFAVPGGDTIQVMKTASSLRDLGLDVDICLARDTIAYRQYDLFHYFNITRPADILYHIARSRKPYVISPIYIDYSEYDKHHRTDITGTILRRFPTHTNEYIKAVARWITRRDDLRSKSYLLKGQKKSIQLILEKAAMVLPNSEAEYNRLTYEFSIQNNYSVVPNGIDEKVFTEGTNCTHEENLVLCAARIEGIKNQLNLIRALNNTRYTLVLVGAAAPNQQSYYTECRRVAAANIIFHDRVTQVELATFYGKAKVHALPSWFETCGLSSLEAAAMGCNITITDKGYTREYFGNDAFYCDPANPDSIRMSIDMAAQSQGNTTLQEKVIERYTWRRAANTTHEAYKKILSV